MKLADFFFLEVGCSGDEHSLKWLGQNGEPSFRKRSKTVVDMKIRLFCDVENQY